MENGACIDAQSQYGFTPIYMAAQEGQEEVVKFLLEAGADHSLPNDEGFCPLDVAMQQGHDNVASLFIQHEEPDFNPV